MPSNVHTFCTKEKDLEAEAMVNRIKEHAIKHDMVFSAIVLSALQQYEEKELNAIWQPKKQKQ